MIYTWLGKALKNLIVGDMSVNGGGDQPLSATKYVLFSFFWEKDAECLFSLVLYILRSSMSAYIEKFKKIKDKLLLGFEHYF